MVHRADIIAVKRDIPLGELMSLFESAAHSRLVVYNETSTIRRHRSHPRSSWRS